jgi:hypothetical protein
LTKYVCNGAVGATGATGAQGLQGPAGPQGATGLLSSGTATGNTAYWDGTTWVLNNSNIYNNGGSVGIGTSTPNSSSKVEISSTTQGFLMPRMTKAQRNTITNPTTGLIIFQTDNTPGFYYYNGTSWIAISGTGSASGIGSDANTLIYTIQGF